MYGFEAITAANGWTITLAGLSIVFSGLLILATLIANVQRLLNLWDNRGRIFKSGKQISPLPEVPLMKTSSEESLDPEVDIVYLTPEQLEVANYFRWITERMGESFSLPRLLEQAEHCGIASPHFHLNDFLCSGLIVECQGDQSGFYRWREDVRIVVKNSNTS